MLVRPGRLLTLLLLAGIPAFACAEAGTAEPVAVNPLPAFHQIEPVAERKRRFFDYLTPLIRAENGRVLEQRARLLAVGTAGALGRRVGAEDARWLGRLARDYRLDPKARGVGELVRALLERVDVIPRSLVLAQAAKESGWGASRFARQGNNLFGQWCFEPGCGLVPARRPAGARHEIRSFDSVGASVAAYVHNLNTHPAYRELRARRAELRARGAPLSGLELATGLERYSQQGERYVREVQALIRQNGLEPAEGGAPVAMVVAPATFRIAAGP